MNQAVPAPAVEVRDLKLEAGGRTLLDGASFKVERGEVVLLVGLSGSGKSLTLKLLLGLSDDVPGITAGGSLLLFGEAASSAARMRAGIVFQDFGLFDEWSARENILFGHDHKRGADPAARGRVADALLAELGLEHAGRVADLSGGMKQRTAIARTLAYDPDILFYDEPTSGLDPAMATQVARRIRTTNDEHGKTSVVVTHDLATLREIADRIILLDSENRTFREVPRDDVTRTLSQLAAAPVFGGDGDAAGAAPLVGRVAHFLEATGRGVEMAAASVVALVPRWPRTSWGLRYLWYYLRLSAFGTALPYVAICGLMLGLLVTYFTFSFLPFKEFTEPILMDQVISGIGYALFRIMAPAMTAMLLAARNGAAVAADIGNRVYSRQVDALRSLGVAPERYFLTNILIAFLIGMPILLAVNFICAAAAGLVVFAFIHPELSTFYWTSEFDRFLDKGLPFWEGTGAVFIKSLVSAFGIGAIAYFFGLAPKASGRDVSRSVTLTIIWSTLYVLAVHLISAFIEFDPI